MKEKRNGFTLIELLVVVLRYSAWVVPGCVRRIKMRIKGCFA